MSEDNEWVSFYDYISYYVNIYQLTKEPQRFKINGIDLMADGTLTADELSDYYIRNIDLNKVWK